MTPEDPTKMLELLLMDGPFRNIYDYMLAREMYLTISDNSEEINKATFGPFFATVHEYSKHYMYISLSKMFDKPDKWSTPRSFHSILQTMENNANNIKLSVAHFIHLKQINGERKQFVTTKTAKGIKGSYEWVGVPSEPTIDVNETTRLVDTLLKSMPSSDKAKNGHELSTIWQTIKTARNKVFAHNDHIERTEWATLEAMDKLLLWCQAALELLARAIIPESIIYFDDGRYISDTDAKKPSINLGRMLNKIGIN